ncbi:MAG TPA: hypothetical protein VGX70_08780 [Gemmataceae bacterium]|nr:hypothetical protein [Gemmataceae bacterium]
MKNHSATSEASAGIWERVIQLDQDLSPTAARALLKVRFSGRDHDHMKQLATKARAGSLTPPEQLQIDTFEQLGCLLDILHSKARRVLNKRRTAG